MTAVRQARSLLSDQRGRIALLVVLIVWVYFLVLFAGQAWRARQLQADVANQRVAIARLELENADLREQVAELGSPAYLERAGAIGRRDFGLARPEETVLLVRWQEADTASPPASPPAAPATADDEPNWQRWFAVLTGD